MSALTAHVPPTAGMAPAATIWNKYDEKNAETIDCWDDSHNTCNAAIFQSLSNGLQTEFHETYLACDAPYLLVSVLAKYAKERPGRHFQTLERQLSLHQQLGKTRVGHRYRSGLSELTCDPLEHPWLTFVVKIPPNYF